MKNMATSIMSPVLFTSLLAFLAIAAQARTLSERSQLISHLKTISNYETRLSPPPPKSSPSPHQLTTAYKRPTPSPPPPPTPSSSPGELTNCGPPCVAGSPSRNGLITMVTDYGKTPRPGTPPTPKPSPSEHEAIVEQLLHRKSSQNYYAASS